MSKRTLYQHFPSKTAVVQEYLRAVSGLIGEPVRPDPEAGDARKILLSLFATHRRAPGCAAALPQRCRRGCRRHARGAGDRPRAEALLYQWPDPTVEGSGAANPRMLGNQLGVLYEGAAALSTSLNDRTAWTHARKAAETLIDAAITDPG